MLGALIAYGIQPGPRLFVEHPDVFWSVIISMYFGNIVLVILNLPLIPYISKLLAVPRTVLLPMIIFFNHRRVLGVFQHDGCLCNANCGDGSDSVKAGQFPTRTVTAWLHIRVV